MLYFYIIKNVELTDIFSNFKKNLLIILIFHLLLFFRTFMPNFSNLTIAKFLIIMLFTLTSCKTIENLPGGDARTTSPDPKERVKKNLEEGKGISLGKMMKGGSGTSYQFASSNPMWRATLEILDFLPLANVDYSGGKLADNCRWCSRI